MHCAHGCRICRGIKKTALLEGTVDIPLRIILVLRKLAEGRKLLSRMNVLEAALCLILRESATRVGNTCEVDDDGPKSRKVIIIESPLLPLHIKDTLARILFNNLQVTVVHV